VTVVMQFLTSRVTSSAGNVRLLCTVNIDAFITTNTVAAQF